MRIRVSGRTLASVSKGIGANSDYSKSLNLLQTAFPLRPDRNASTDGSIEHVNESIYNWQSKKNSGKPNFVLHDGPPYANGDLHLGHAMNKILKDFIARLHIAQGMNVSFVPGWDCHGLPIELKALQKSRESDRPIAPLEIRAQAKIFAESAIVSQMKSFKSFGVVADWKNYWTTMNHDFEMRQLRVFQKMLKQGLLRYQFKPVFWSPSALTALAEGELEYNDNHKSTATFVKFSVKNPEVFIPSCPKLYALIWTTTPWTILANRAICFNSRLEYCIIRLRGDYFIIGTSRLAELRKDLGDIEIFMEKLPQEVFRDLQYVLPWDSKVSFQFLDADFVTSESGTGLVHCAPGHGHEDYSVCKRNGIVPYSPVDKHGRFTKDAGSDVEGMFVLDQGTGQVLKKLEALGVLVASQRYTHKYPYDWRTKQPIIVRSAAQWFADLTSIKESAIRALENVRTIPVNGSARLISFIKSREEWCISRQRSWGVPIPILYDANNGEPLIDPDAIAWIITQFEQKGTNAWWEEGVHSWTPPGYAQREFTKGIDTMDVWFDSGTSWTMLEERSEGSFADVYLEGSDQHRGWFQSSLLTHVASKMEARAPYSTLITHGFTLDQKGRKMSKSLGNVMTPDEIISGTKHVSPLGVDGLRLWVAECEYTRDITVGPQILKHVSEHYRKIRNTIRFMLSNLSDWENPRVEYHDLHSIVDKLALAQLAKFKCDVMSAYRELAFSKAVNSINHYTNTALSSFYFDIIKDRLYADLKDGSSRRSAQTVLLNVGAARIRY